MSSQGQDQREHREAVVICEGFNDRAFLKGALHKLGCSDLKGKKRGDRVPDGWSEFPGGKAFLFQTASGRSIRLVPAGSRDNVLNVATPWIKLRQGELRTPIVLVFDADQSVTDGRFLKDAVTVQSVKDSLAHNGCTEAAPNTFVIDQCTVIATFWRCDDPASDFLPDLHCLERLVIASIIAAYPDRAEPVKQWLADRPNPPESRSPKEFSWSHMAGWYADDGCDEFFQGIWRDEKIAAQLQQRLTDNGTWGILESLAQ